MTEILRSFYRILAFANLNFVPNLFSLFGSDEFSSPADRFAEEGVSRTFLLTAGDVLTAV
jgi:hypothetical protein